MKKLIFFQILLLAWLISCNTKKDVDVLVNSSFIKANNVIVDDTIDLKKFASKDSFTIIPFKSGEHKLSVNKKVLKNFTVGTKGGILNLDHQAYVIFPIKYKTDNDVLGNASFMSGLPIIIDSTVIYQKTLAKNQTELISLLKSPNFKDMITNSHVKIEKDQLFIDKDWDYGINEKIPDTIITSTEMVVQFKKKIDYTYTFLAYAFLSDDYNIEKITETELFNLLNKLKDLKTD
jgi:hypothetical protein